MKRIKSIETSYPIRCPFCDTLIKDDKEDGPCFSESGECEHLLFIATDDGFEEFTTRFCENMKIDLKEVNSPDDAVPEDLNIDEFTDNVTIAGSIKYAIYEGLVGSFGAYFGFAPAK